MGEQVTLRPVCLDELVSADHQARVVRAYVEGLDLSALYGEIKAVDGHGGRAATGPRIVLSLWLYATLARNRGLQRLLARGRRKVRAIALLFALAHNLLRTVALRA